LHVKAVAVCRYGVDACVDCAAERLASVPVRSA